MAIYQYIDTVNPSKLYREIVAAGLPAPERIGTTGPEVFIHTSEDWTQEQQTTLGATVAAHVPISTAESVSNYLLNQVYPFVHRLICNMAAENVALGITQAGKTGHVLSLFTKQYPIPTAQHLNSLKACLDTGSLYTASDLIQYIRDNPAEYDGLSPFITDARLSKMKNDIAAFLAGP